jgi:spectinomycin phosphotransferase
VQTRPTDLDDAAVTASLAEGWDVRTESVSYLPEGGGAHHWKVVDRSGRPLFVTVDDLDNKDWLGDTREAAFTGLRHALGTAAALHRDAGLGFVVAPIQSVADDIVRRLDDRYAMSVYPFLIGESFPFGPHTDPQRRAEVLDLLAALHSAARAVRGLPPPHQLTVGGRRDLDTVLGDPDRPWAEGPFAEPARALVASCAPALTELLEAFDRLVESTTTARSDTVLTHGEPHPANVMSVDGRLVLLDWDTVALAAPERDLWMVTSDSAELAHYSNTTGHTVDPSVMTLYRLRWYLDDIASATRLLRASHQESSDTRRNWHGLRDRLARLPTWQRRLS